MRAMFRLTELSRTLRTRIAGIARQESGFALAEMLVAFVLLTAGTVATFSLFSSSKALSTTSQRHEVAVHVAQSELERLHSLPYAQLGLTRAPAASSLLETDPTKLGFFTTAATTDATSFTVKSANGTLPAVSEKLVLTDSAPSGTVDPGPTPFDVAGVKGKIYRYVTWRPENCGTDTAGREYCPGNRDTKRLLIEVKTDTSPRSGPQKPVWVASITFDPSTEPYQ
jgi:Tfp pilus assembly protein PilV